MSASDEPPTRQRGWLAVALATVSQAFEKYEPERDIAAEEREPERSVLPARAVPPGALLVEEAALGHGPAAVRILRRPETASFEYEILEPPLEPAEELVRAFLHGALLRSLVAVGGSRAQQTVHLDGAIDAAMERHAVALDAVGRARVRYHLHRDLLGFGCIDALLADPEIEDVSCDGPGIPVYVFHRKYESMRTNVVFAEERDLDRFVISLAQRCGKQISVADPILDATLPDMSRLQATLAREVTTRGSSFTIRKFRADPFTPPDLIRLGSVDARLAAWLWLAFEGGRNLLFAGGTASGKTTLLNASCLFIPPQKKIVSIEETREINLSHENWIASATRSGFAGEAGSGRGAGAIDLYKLLEAALRQRPEYILVGEVRGPETFTLFQAMSTGHAVYSTMHADSASAAVHRLENEPLNIPRLMVEQVDAFVIQGLVRLRGRLVRRVLEVVEVAGVDAESGDLLTNTVFRWDPATDSFRYLGKSVVLEELGESRLESAQQVQAEWGRREDYLRLLADGGCRRLEDVASAVAEYRRDAAGAVAARRARSGGTT